jgi:hypothetical protein
MIIQVLNKDRRSHLVAIVKGKHLILFVECLPEPVAVPEAENRDDLLSPWFVFNDFSVQNISEEEALSFPGKWKVRQIPILKCLRLIIWHRSLPSCTSSEPTVKDNLTILGCLILLILQFSVKIPQSQCSYYCHFFK